MDKFNVSMRVSLEGGKEKVQYKEAGRKKLERSWVLSSYIGQQVEGSVDGRDTLSLRLPLLMLAMEQYKASTCRLLAAL